MKHLLLALSLSLAGLFGPAHAGDNPVVVELFTSQGCSSCPPADRIMHELAERDDVIGLALHVDYWDYIGWQDPFGSAAHADRQRAYAAQGNRRTIYTPEMIVGGSTDIVGAKPMKLSKAIAEHAQAPDRVALTLERQGQALRITARPLVDLPEGLTIHMLRYTPLRTTHVKRGENRGKTLENANIVEDWQVLGTWNGATPLEMTAQVEGDKPVVVLIQQDTVGPILAAGRLR